MANQLFVDVFGFPRSRKINPFYEIANLQSRKSWDGTHGQTGQTGRYRPDRPDRPDWPDRSDRPDRPVPAGTGRKYALMCIR